MAVTSNYKALDEVCSKIDRRHTKYRFDLETDIPWDRLHEPGLFLPPEYMRTIGIKSEVLDAYPEAADLMQWALGLSTALNFVDLEEDVLALTRGPDAADFATCRSIELLNAEEDKHIELFSRYARHLKSLRPDLVPRIMAHFALSQYMRGRDVPGAADAPELAAVKSGRIPERPRSPGTHCRFWLSTLLFEEYTIYLHDCLVAAGDAIQPTWAASHAAHRQEEIQHVVTDLAMVKATNLTTEQLRLESIMQVVDLSRIIHYYTGRNTACAVVREVFPNLPAFEDDTPFLKSPFVEAIKTAKAFAHTRSFPGFDFR